MPAINVTQVLQLAIAAQGRRQFLEAEKLYRQVLSADPRQADALHLLGVLMHQTGRSVAGIEHIQRAIAISPRIAMYHANLGHIFHDIRQFAFAAECLQNAGILDPSNPTLRLKLAYLLNNELNRQSEAVPIYKSVLATHPQTVDALSGLAVALHRLGDISEALVYYRQAYALNPTNAGMLSNFASALLASGDTGSAIAMYNAAIALEPGNALFWNNLGVVHMSIEATEPAIAAFEKALEFKPGDMMVQVNLAAMLRARGEVEEAAVLYTKLIEQHPNVAELHNNLGLTRLSQGRQEEAIAAMRQAVALNPDGPMIFDNLLLSLHYDDGYDAARLYAEHRVWAEFIESRTAPGVLSSDFSPERRLRVGYVSADFRAHSVSYFLEPILARHDRRAFEVFCYANQPTSDATTARLRSHADHWRNIYKLSDNDVTDLIQRDQIDILMDLSLHTQANRLRVFARRPAPLQGTYLGYASTTGLRAIDFRLTDSRVDPPGISEAHHTEKLVCLPDTHWVYRPPKEAPEIFPLPAEQNNHITFGVAANFAKINPTSIAMWSEVLRALAGSVLIIKGSGAEDSATRRHFLDAFAGCGIPEKQLRFERQTSLAEYFQFFSRIDLVLDTFPFAGGTTSCHALYMGVPVITRTGNTSVSRVGASLLQNVGLRNLIADSSEAFVRDALELSCDIPRLGRIRTSLRKTLQASPLMDEPRFVQNLEAAYRELWKERCARRTHL